MEAEGDVRFDVDANAAHGGISLLVVARVNEDFVEYLVQAGHEGYLSILEPALRIHDPHALLTQTTSHI